MSSHQCRLKGLAKPRSMCDILTHRSDSFKGEYQRDLVRIAAPARDPPAPGVHQRPLCSPPEEPASRAEKLLRLHLRLSCFSFWSCCAWCSVRPDAGYSYEALPTLCYSGVFVGVLEGPVPLHGLGIPPAW